MKPALKRRDFLLAAGSSAWLAACGRESQPLAAGATGLRNAPDESPAFQHGVASGDPLSDRMILWTRVTQSPAAEVDVNWLIALDPALSQIVGSGVAHAGADRDYTVKVDVQSLSAGTTYYYRFMLPDGGSPIGRTRTLPAGAVEHLRIALVTCSDSGGVFNAYARVAERADLDLVLHLGDYVYADTDITLEQYRSRHRACKADHPELRELHRQHPMIAIWDDHETCNDAYQDGAPAPNPAVGPAWELRKGFATQTYFDYLPIRDNSDGSRRIYRDFALGDLLDLFMLDTRLEGRDAQVSGQDDAARTDPARSMLGSGQEAWIAERLRGSRARWKLVGNQVMLGHLNETNGSAPTNNWMDQWDGYPPARQRLYDVLKGDATHPKIDNVVIATGDWHNSFIMDLPDDPLSGYDGASGAGSLAVEFVTPSITSGFFGVSDLAQFSPHIKHHNDQMHGYQLLDIQPERVIGEEWQVDTVGAVSTTQTRAVAFEVRDGENHLRPYADGPTVAKPDAPAPAP